MNPTLIGIGDRIKSRRMQLGISQRRLAQIAGIYQSQISRYEKGEVEPNALALMTIAQALQISSDWLLGLSEAQAFQKDEALNALEQQALLLFRANPPEKQRAVIEILRLA